MKHRADCEFNEDIVPNSWLGTLIVIVIPLASFAFMCYSIWRIFYK